MGIRHRRAVGFVSRIRPLAARWRPRDGLLVGTLANTLPLPGGIGGVEGGMIGAFLAFGVNASLAVLAVLTYGAISYWLPTLPERQPTSGCAARWPGGETYRGANVDYQVHYQVVTIRLSIQAMRTVPRRRSVAGHVGNHRRRVSRCSQ